MDNKQGETFEHFKERCDLKNKEWCSCNGQVYKCCKERCPRYKEVSNSK